MLQKKQEILSFSRRLFIAVVVAVVLSMSLHNTARAGDAFPQGTWTVTAATGYSGGWGQRHEDIPWLSVGVNYYVISDLSLGLEASGWQVLQPGDDATTVALAAVLRHHVYDNGRTTVFLDFAFGPNESTDDVPAEGTQFNFITRTGVGATYRLENDFDLIGGIRYFHLSNAQIEGSDRNPSINGAEFYIGLMWQW